MRSFSIFMEKLWLIIAIVSFIVVIYMIITQGGFTRRNVQYLVFPFLAGLMYGFRTIFRKRMERNQDL